MESYIGIIPKNILQFKDREEPYAYLVERSPDVYIISHVTDGSESIKRDYVLDDIDNYKLELSSDQLEHTFIANMYDKNYMLEIVIQCEPYGETLYDLIDSPVQVYSENHKIFEYHNRKYTVFESSPNDAVYVHTMKAYK